MTRNQIDYQKMVEEKRANQARERETNRANLAKEAEDLRSHQASERLTQDQNVETNRANLAREAETNRSNLAKELETNRSNLAKEGETHRSNVANENIARNRIATESADSRYATDSKLAGTMYTADVGYQGRTDAAYINQYGISKTDASGLASTIGNGIKSVSSKNKAGQTVAGSLPGLIGLGAAIAQAAPKIGVAAVSKTVPAVKSVKQNTQPKVAAPQVKPSAKPKPKTNFKPTRR